MSTSHTQHPSDDERLQDLLDGRLDEADAAALRARIEAEPDLREAWEELRGLQALVREYALAGSDAELPDDFLLGVRARIGAQASPPEVASGLPAPRRRPGRMLHMLTISYAVAALLVVGFTVRYVLQDEPPPAREVHTADEPVDRQAPPSTMEGDVTADETADARQHLEKENGAGSLGAPEPSGGLETKSPRPAPVPPTRAPGAKDAGPFGGPGGMVPPGVRPLPGTKARRVPSEDKLPENARLRRGGKRPLDARAKLGSLLEDPDGTGAVYVLEVADAAQARRELGVLLAKVTPLDTSEDAPDSSPPRREKAEGAAKRGGAAPSRLYRVEGAQARLLLASLRRSQPPSGGAKGEQDKDDAKAGRVPGGDTPAADARDDESEALGTQLTFVDLVTRDLDEGALAQLDGHVVEGVWGAAGFAPGAKKSAPPKPGAPAAPAPTTPGAPAPAKPEADAPAEESEPAAAPRAQPSKSAGSRRVRILIVERK